MKSCPTAQPTSLADFCRRRNRRVPLDILVEIRGPHRAEIASLVNLGLDGMLVRCTQTLPPGTELTVRFNLPYAHSITAPSRVVHNDPGCAMELKFLHLPRASRHVLASFTGSLMKYMRRGGRIARRHYLLLQEVGSQSSEVAETVVISRHGGLLVCRAGFTTENRLWVWWPEKKRGAQARVVFRRVSGTGGLVELGFEFTDVADFWDLDFPIDSA